MNARTVGTMDMWRLPNGSIVKERFERSPVSLMPSATEKRTITTHHSEPRHASRAQGTVADIRVVNTGCGYGSEQDMLLIFDKYFANWHIVIAAGLSCDDANLVRVSDDLEEHSFHLFQDGADSIR